LVLLLVTGATVAVGLSLSLLLQILSKDASDDIV
jgi:hypothetical protein